MNSKQAIGKHKRLRGSPGRCRKANFYSFGSAKSKLLEIQEEAPPTRKIPHRAYRCDRCPFWHLTSTRKSGALKKGAAYEGSPT